MTKEELIKQLNELPDGVQVCIYDWRKNLYDDSGDGSSEGIHSDFEVELMTLSEEEAEYYKEQHEKEFVPFIALSFENEDYDDEGKPTYE